MSGIWDSGTTVTISTTTVITKLSKFDIYWAAENS